MRSPCRDQPGRLGGPTRHRNTSKHEYLSFWQQLSQMLMCPTLGLREDGFQKECLILRTILRLAIRIDEDIQIMKVGGPDSSGDLRKPSGSFERIQLSP